MSKLWLTRLLVSQTEGGHTDVTPLFCSQASQSFCQFGIYRVSCIPSWSGTHCAAEGDLCSRSFLPLLKGLGLPPLCAPCPALQRTVGLFFFLAIYLTEPIEDSLVPLLGQFRGCTDSAFSYSCATQVAGSELLAPTLQKMRLEARSQ